MSDITSEEFKIDRAGYHEK